MSRRALVDRALIIAAAEIGVKEEGGPNRGPRVEQYLAAAGGAPGQSWCAAFVYWAFAKAAKELAAELGHVVENPVARTVGVHKMFFRTVVQMGVVSTNGPTRGCLFFHDSGGGKGHVGFVWDTPAPYGQRFVDLAGNSNDEGSREGKEVCHNDRPWAYANLGFVDLARGER